jgi:hypothetical protein
MSRIIRGLLGGKKKRNGGGRVEYKGVEGV